MRRKSKNPKIILDTENILSYIRFNRLAKARLIDIVNQCPVARAEMATANRPLETFPEPGGSCVLFHFTAKYLAVSPSPSIRKLPVATRFSSTLVMRCLRAGVLRPSKVRLSVWGETGAAVTSLRTASNCTKEDD
jgi:hypothetical protein